MIFDKLTSAIQVYTEHGLEEVATRAFFYYGLEFLVRRAGVDRDVLKAMCADRDSLFEYGSDGTVRIDPPEYDRIPQQLTSITGTHDSPASFVCTIPNARLFGTFAMCQINKGGIVVEPHRPKGANNTRSHEHGLIANTFNKRLRETFLELGIATFFKAYFDQRLLSVDSPDEFDRAAHFVMRLPTNYGHWTLEYLPKVRGLEHYREQTGTDPVVLINPDPPRWIVESLKLMGLSEEDLVEWDQERAQVGELVLPSTRYTHSHDYEPAPADRRWVRQRAWDTIDWTPGEAGTRVYISRQQQDARRVVNYDDVMKILRPYGFEVVEMETLSVREQVETCAEADVIVGPHGAGISNAIWAKDATLLEFHPNGYVSVAMLSLSRECGLEYRFIEGDRDTAERGPDSKDRNIHVNPDTLRSEMDYILPEDTPSAQK